MLLSMMNARSVSACVRGRAASTHFSRSTCVRQVQQYVENDVHGDCTAAETQHIPQPGCQSAQAGSLVGQQR
jgi:hypothetical protein